MQDIFKKISAQENSAGDDLSDDKMLNILHEYEKSLVFPNKNSYKQFILCPVGLVGSGKTTILKKLTHEFLLLRISTDEIRDLLKSKGFNTKRTAEMAVNLFDKYLQQGYSIAVDADCAGQDVQRIINDFTQKYNLITIWIHVKTPEQEILKRLQLDNTERQFRGEEAINDYYRRKKLHDNLNIDFTYIFNETTLDLGIQIPEAIKKIKYKLENN